MGTSVRQIGHYEITGTLGEGGMGVVYSARDARLDRTVALKMIRRGSADAAAAERLRREARAAAAVSHPNICQLYDIGEEEGDLFIAMEYLEGESLAKRLERGPVPLDEAVRIALAMLAALEALHGRGLIHRDLKPSNVFLTPHGVKLLDFGLARPVAVSDAETRLTGPGTIFGTPQYMSPESVLGRPVDARGDLFAAGVVLYEMLTGTAPFTGATVPAVVHAIAYEHPPALGGSPGIAAVDRVIHKAIAKRPEDRYASASAMAEELRAATPRTDSGTALQIVRPMTRLIVLPFRVLRPDPDIDFLAFSLADALTTSLSALEALVVRSSLTAAALGGDSVDLATIADKADVDVVLTGTLLRAADQVRVTTQLVEVPGGTVRWSQTTQVTLGDIFQLQDALTTRIVESLAVPLSARDEKNLKRDVPATAKAFEFYLRANQMAYASRDWTLARDLYRQCVEEDPRYAPAWARLGRINRVISLYSDEASEQDYPLAEEAFQRALDLNPDLPFAHNHFTIVELETGRARQAMQRLLERARSRSADAELFAGLVQACRYAGLERPAITAHEHARRIDPQIRTAVAHAYFAIGDYEKVIETDQEDPPIVTGLAIELLGRRDEAIAQLLGLKVPGIPRLFHHIVDTTVALLRGDREAALTVAEMMIARWPLRDPCSTYYLARTLAATEHPRAMEMLRRSIEGGFHAYSLLTRDPWLNPVRGTSEFAELLTYGEQQYREGVEAFVAAGGERILGPAT